MEPLPLSDKVILSLCDGLTEDDIVLEFELSEDELNYLVNLRATSYYCTIINDWRLKDV